ncbi:phage major capsid protein [Gordonia sp. SND2]|uniref:phage major capsid protein n=1 Tax=Gordonia sp. SND2 TaxID=3388659 RepID=UPI00398A5F71
MSAQSYSIQRLKALSRELDVIEKSKTMTRAEKLRRAGEIAEESEELRCLGAKGYGLPDGITAADLARGDSDPDFPTPGAAANARAFAAFKSQRPGRRGSLLPLAFDRAAVKELGERAARGENVRIVSKAASVAGLIPSDFQPGVLGPVHEQRLLDFLPTVATSAPVVEYLRHSSSTGGAGVVAEGTAKPELVPTLDNLSAPIRKIAVHGAVTYEAIADYTAFASYFTGELMRDVIDVETAQILHGDGTGQNLTGLQTTSGALMHAVDTAGGETPLDAIESSIAELRVGAALAVADLLVLHPTTWSAIRRSKDSQQRYLVAPDPTRGEADTLWGIPVVTTIAQTVGTALLLDTTKFGKVFVREGITVQTGTSNDDFVRNVSRFVVEERLAVAVERPAAILTVTGLA